MTSRSSSAVRSTSAKGSRPAASIKSEGNSSKTTARAGSGAATPTSRAGSGAATPTGATIETEDATAAAPVKPIKYCPKRPAHGFSAVTDDRWSSAAADAAKCGPPCCVPNGCAKPEHHYACDRQAAKALAQYLSPDERGKVLRWLDAMQHLAVDAGGGVDVDEQSERSMYMTCLLMLLRTGRLVAPFTRAPPTVARPLKPLRDAIDRRLYKRVQIECRRRRLSECARYELDGAGHRPSEFFDRMPEPSGGMICYGAAFSNM